MVPLDVHPGYVQRRCQFHSRPPARSCEKYFKALQCNKQETSMAECKEPDRVCNKRRQGSSNLPVSKSVDSYIVVEGDIVRT